MHYGYLVGHFCVRRGNGTKHVYLIITAFKNNWKNAQEINGSTYMQEAVWNSEVDRNKVPRTLLNIYLLYFGVFCPFDLIIYSK